MSELSPLRTALDETMAAAGCTMKDLTVLATQNDPFRVDRPAMHRDGQWLADTARELGLGERNIHLRGLHYMVLGRPKPDGTPYTNTESDWEWLQSEAGKAARWLGYIPFDQIVDQRNAAPVIHTFERPEPAAFLNVGINVELPDPDAIKPTIFAAGFEGVQPYKLVYVGEKASLQDVLLPLALHYQADLYLPTGEISDTMAYQMARTGAKDGRPMVVLYFSDCDPAGWQMPISVARKLQALKVLEFEELEFEVHRVALTPEQVRDYGLPSTPLKETEPRADRWREAMGVEQTEIDALASLRPELLKRLAKEATEPFFDRTLSRRVSKAKQRWTDAAQAVVDDMIDEDELARIRGEAAVVLAGMQEQIDELNKALRVEVTYDDLPVFDIPEAELDGVHPLPLLDSRWPFLDQCRELIGAKRYHRRPTSD